MRNSYPSCIMILKRRMDQLVCVNEQEGNRMYRISDKTLRILLVICILILVASLPFTLHFTSATASGNCGNTQYNLSMIRENLIDFENYQNLPVEDRGIRKSSMYIILREGLDNQWSLIYQSDKKLNKECWTSEDLAGFDTVVLVIGYGKNQAYRQGDNGPTTSIYGEAISLQFFDIAEQKIVARDSINNIFPLPPIRPGILHGTMLKSSNRYTRESLSIVSR